MLDGILSTNSISFIIVFLEGLISFFSPCVIPLIPIYMGYLAGNTQQREEDGTIIYNRTKVFFHTVFFVFGISFAFFILGMSFTALGTFFQSNQLLFTRIGGMLIVVLGLFQLGIFELKFLQRERKLNFRFANKKMSPLVAFLMGFTFSFAWTPCVGPALSSVLILASSAQNSFIGNLLVLLYAVGFIIPFLLLGLFTTQVLNFLKHHQKLLQYTVKLGGILLIIIGIMTFTGWMNGISKYLNAIPPQSFGTKQEDTIISEENSTQDALETEKELPEASNDKKENVSEEKQKKAIPAYDFTLIDQYGNEHTLSDYKGKVVFLNFWASWCGPCLKEMPDIEDLYQEYNKNADDIVILGVANPKTKEYPNNYDMGKDQLTLFLADNELTFPTVFDETGEFFDKYFISSFPTTFMINKDGDIHGYISGMLTKDLMKNIIQDTIKSTE